MIVTSNGSTCIFISWRIKDIPTFLTLEQDATKNYITAIILENLETYIVAHLHVEDYVSIGWL